VSPAPDWPIVTERLLLRPNEWVKGEWQSELDYALLAAEWRG
jgi:hypothetical protein